MDNNKKFLYVLSTKDIQELTGCTYRQAINLVNKMDHFYINSKPYIFASEFFKEKQYNVVDVEAYIELDYSKNKETKFVKVMPQLYTVSDIREIFGCGNRQAYEIMDIIPFTFKIKNKKYVEQSKFVEWVESLEERK